MGTFIASWKLQWGFHKLPYPIAMSSQVFEDLRAREGHPQ